MSDAAFIGFATAAAQYGLNSILVRPKRAIGPFVMQVVIEEHHVDELEITDHPVEQGAIISDHAYKRPAEVRIVGGWSDSPSIADLFKGIAAAPAATVDGVQSLISGNDVSQARAMYANMLSLQQERVTMDVYTGKRVYRDMLIKGLQTTTDKEHEHSVVLTIQMRQVIIVTTRLVTLAAPVSQQAEPESTGAVVEQGTRSPTPSTRYATPGAGRGFVNPSLP